MMIALIAFLFMALPCSPVYSHGDGPHGEETRKPNAQPQKTNRLFKSGSLFEVVLDVNFTAQPNTTILLSENDTNIPLKGATIDFGFSDHLDEFTSIKVMETSESGIYQAHIPQKEAFKIRLKVHKGQQNEDFIFDNGALSGQMDNAALSGGKMAVLILLIMGASGILYILYKRRPKIIMVALLFTSMPLSICSGHGDGEEDDHHHDHDTSQMASTQGGIIVPKEVQFHLGITTQKVEEKPIKGSLRMIGKVISDPAGYARLQVSQTSRVINHSTYPLPLPGQRVKTDEVILAVAPTLTKVETGDQRSALYKAESEITQFRKEVDRLEKLGKFAIQKNLDNAKAELEKALKQKEEILNQTFKPEVLKSPIDGFIADLHVRPGEIITPDKTIVEIIDPDKFLIEAQVFNPTIAQEIVQGYARLPFNPQNLIGLKVIGVSPKVNPEDQSIHILFKPDGKGDNVKLDMAIEVIAELKETQPTIIVPKSSLVEDISGSWVFIPINPETFEPRKVKIRRSVDDFVEVEEGLEKGEKIVTQGANLLHEAR